ncbi:MAG TPA: PQQ-binding-like beta-propeller repeat protein [Candidatus Acidoferrales bacterium]|nr:PQQ-binding-like beta-propeller repeat protein [Candidatus Acidoferrales bacterium]
MKPQRAFILTSVVVVGLLVTAFARPWHVHAQEAPKQAAPEITTAAYTGAQAAQGKAAYAKSCASCHGQDLGGSEFASSLKGAAFNQNWAGKTAGELFTYITTKMPPANPGELGAEANAQIIAYILQGNGVRASITAELPSDAKGLAAMILPRIAPGQKAAPMMPLSPLAPPIPVVTLPNPLAKITPVTDELLQNPPPSDWLVWRRTYDDHGFSPLKQINKSNVGDLRVAWAWSLPNGQNEATPLEHDGVLFVHSYNDRVQALNAVTGDLLWQYSRQLPSDARASVKRNLAIYRDRLIVPTSDDHVVALDVKTGNVIWDQEIADYKKGWQVTGGPLVAKGKVMQGVAGQAPGGCVIVALDFETGKEAWRFYTIARPGENGGESWNGLPLEKRNGASVWTAGSYDPQLNLAYFGVGQTYDTGPLLHSINQPGITNDGLYTDCTLAFNPDTGKLVWYFQHVHNDQWDLDWAFEQQLIKLPVNGALQKLVVTSGKMGIYEGMDAATGKYIFSKDLGIQNVVTSIDPKTGEKTINPEVVVGDGKAHMICPHPGGGRSWIATSYNAETKMLYIPMVESCMDLIPAPPGERGNLTSGVNWFVRPRPDTDGKYGRVEAFNLETKKVVWIDRQRAPQSTGVLATAGGVVFAGSLDRFLKAYDDSTGETLWQVRMNDVPSSCPITYSVNGKQYVAVVVGNGGAQTVTFPVLVPEIQNPPDHGAAIWVFELPDKKR